MQSEWVAEWRLSCDNHHMLSQTQSREFFFDNNATTRPLPQVQEAMLDAMNESFGNPSSAHRGGELARRLIAKSRVHVANLIGADSRQVVFTSGATESNNWIVFSGLKYLKNGRLLISKTEHSSIQQLAENHFEIASSSVLIPVDSNGLIDLVKLAQLCGEAPSLVSTHWVNNETGVIQPIAEIAEICSMSNCLLHVDASQAAGKLPLRFGDHSIDFMTIASHKLHGPQGIGAICCRDTELLGPLLFGGGQENNLRPGTENLPGIAGFGKAAEMRQGNFDQVVDKLRELRDMFERQVFASISNVYTNGSNVDRVCNTSNLRFEGVDGQALVAQLDSKGVRCSQSSACTAQIPESSYVLRAMGLTEEEAYSSVRFSFSELNTSEEVEKVVEILTKRVTQLRDFQGCHKSTISRNENEV